MTDAQARTLRATAQFNELTRQFGDHSSAMLAIYREAKGLLIEVRQQIDELIEFFRQQGQATSHTVSTIDQLAAEIAAALAEVREGES